MLTIGALVGTSLLGFLAGLFSFKVKCRWCPECGATTAPTPGHPDGARPASEQATRRSGREQR